MNYTKQTFKIDECITFCKTNEKYGGLSNMAGNYPIYLNGTKILTSEALYQACRFPNYPEIQDEIIRQRSPMTAKDISRKYERYTREDWQQKRIPIMNWCIHLKLVYNWRRFGRLLESTEDKNIVEISYKDNFWGAYKEGIYAIGCNVLGQLLQLTRNDFKENQEKQYITLGLPNVKRFIFLGEYITELRIDVTKNYHENENLNLFDDFNLN